jgi:hypothetical protein
MIMKKIIGKELKIVDWEKRRQYKRGRGTRYYDTFIQFEGINKWYKTDPQILGARRDENIPEDLKRLYEACEALFGEQMEYNPESAILTELLFLNTVLYGEEVDIDTPEESAESLKKMREEKEAEDEKERELYGMKLVECARRFTGEEE